jgi:hypothetical protein
MRPNEFPILRTLELMKAERSKLSSRGPRFVILHRFWQPETNCVAGEVIAEVLLIQHGKRVSVPLSTRLLLVFDYLARHQRLPQSASQIAAGMRLDPFCLKHGTNAAANRSLSKRVSRTAVKQQIVRLRAALTSAFAEAGLSLDPGRVVVSEETAVNEVRYFLKAAVEWEHVEH